jgi:hypothetical protein
VFLKDTSMPARQRVVDHLLGTPQYGERWARHFMDIWRYCDWYGLGAQLRHSQKHIWHWRDWIVESLNTDKGYDQMIVQMLAADELAPEDRDNLRATGFLARSYYLFNRTTWLDETIEHTCRAFLGLTMQCVKCHDHKYDPIEQATTTACAPSSSRCMCASIPGKARPTSRRTACRVSSTSISTNPPSAMCAATKRTRTSRSR